MKIALVGTGKTGQSIHRLAEENGHEIVARFSSSSPLLEATSKEALRGADVLIDFTAPQLALSHIERYCTWQTPAVIGTTGWYDSLEQVEAWVDHYQACLLYAPNFSIGVAVTSRLIELAANLMNQLPAYDGYVHEFHHRLKVDSPSGTAIHLANKLLQGLDRKTYVVTETQHQAIHEDALHVSSTRTGHIFGQHTVGFDSPYDHITITHESKTRDSFAFGALRAAEWLIGRQGLFTLDDLLEEWL